MDQNVVVIVLTTILVTSTMLIETSKAQPMVPGVFVFGDSLSDAGSNNPLLYSTAKANFLPYGIDFPGGATGRFCNGKVAIDLVVEKLQMPDLIPAFPIADTKDIALGVNYASGSAGIRPETGFQVGERIPMEVQVKRHQEIVGKIQQKLGPNATAHLSSCLYSIYPGANDWMLNYYIRPSMRLLYPLADQYADALIDELTKHIHAIYDTGARKFMVWGMMPLGCLPSFAFYGSCSDFVNGDLTNYNEKLKAMVDRLNTELPGSNFIWINTMMIMGPKMFNNIPGIKEHRTPCCGAFNFLCLPLMIPCLNRDEHAYWDMAHPTQHCNEYLAARAFIAQDPTDSHPMDIKSLALAPPPPPP